MSASRLTTHYALFARSRQFREASEDVSYADETGATINLKACIARETVNPLDEDRGADGVYQIERATVECIAVNDPVFCGVVLDTVQKIRAFKGRNFSFPIQEGGVVADGWIVKTVSGSAGTWEFGCVRETRKETGNTRRAVK